VIEIFNKKINPILKFSIDKKLANEIIQFSKLNYKNRDIFLFNGFGRQYCNINKHEITLKEKINVFQKKCMNRLNIKKYYPEKIYGNFIGVHALKNTSVHFHSDPRDKEDNIHFRLLFMLQNAKKGGNPVLQNTKLNVKNLQGWINFASEWEHGSVPIDGKTLRIILSMGAYVPKKEFNKWKP